MAYLRPAWFTRRVFNPLAIRFGIGDTTGLSVPGRRTGRVHTVPVVLVEHDGARYLVSSRGETEWVRNLRAADGQAEIRRRREAERVHAAEVPVGARAPLLDAYRRKNGRVVEPYFAKLPDPADHPVFRIETVP